jgi:hypothetical protein
MMHNSVIMDPTKRGRTETAVGLKGIANSTSLGPQQRQRVLSGIIEVDQRKKTPMMTASAVKTATQREMGMVHIPGTY